MERRREFIKVLFFFHVFYFVLIFNCYRGLELCSIFSFSDRRGFCNKNIRRCVKDQQKQPMIRMKLTGDKNDNFMFSFPLWNGLFIKILTALLAGLQAVLVHRLIFAVLLVFVAVTWILVYAAFRREEKKALDQDTDL